MAATRTAQGDAWLARYAQLGPDRMLAEEPHTRERIRKLREDTIAAIGDDPDALAALEAQSDAELLVKFARVVAAAKSKRGYTA